MVEKKKKKKSGNPPKKINFNLSSAVPYTKAFFGLEHEQVGVYFLDISVNDLLKNFRIFEEMNNVEVWPISTLIQRELDHGRAKQIAVDYLLNSGVTKYFPPLISVMIPTGKDYLPLDNFQDIDTTAFSTSFVDGSIKHIDPEKYQDFDDDTIEIAGGIFEIPFDQSSGDIVWDNNRLSSVIIDGQHRFKALKEAAAIDKDIFDLRVTVTLIDLPSLCKRNKRKPTEIARDLFVTINNTPVEVNETRLVLMDDKDVLACFTQALVDDADKTSPPSIKPEVVDWDCEGGKHNTDISLSGVLTIRQIIQTCIFDDKKASSIDDRQNQRNIQQWLSKLDAWVSPDDEIKRLLSEQETFKHRMDTAKQSTADDDEDEESSFLYSWSPSASKIAKKEFSSKYKEVFRYVFDNLEPFKEFYQIAGTRSAFDEGSGLRTYLRSFTGKRKELEKDSSTLTVKSVNAFKKEISNLTSNNICFSVMGQKSIFKALFDEYLSEVEDKNKYNLMVETKNFVNDFNTMYEAFNSSSVSDEVVFSLEYKNKKSKPKSAYKSLELYFWSGIIRKANGEIDYSKKAIDILSKVIIDLILAKKESSLTSFTSSKDITNRHISQLKKLLPEEDDDFYPKNANRILLSKLQHVISVL
ncbi:hypothetical protein MD535_20670 [Vibrio sp. ZSDZ65]|uniref:DGQHR domain-containing protein n=1 Tax=Vibrio qingdaonensis TaxID=2829491 RepID=A0A9X3CRP7_9VIBR|nr:DNA sulfur modification protein DndB [Vibrio qingdaonensis]MCW8348403.1 hypothetical protein [Vibrio qingdaonensis]